jgi:hypothetical protein
MIWKIFEIDLLDFQRFNSRNFRKPILFEYKSEDDLVKNLQKIFSSPEVQRLISMLYSQSK